jgi:hypothetical protein
MYQMDVYSAITWNGVIRHRESQSTVLYPAEVNDEDITENEILPHLSGRPPWMKGWIFVVDLYRILEHAADRLRARKTLSPDDPSSPVSMLFERERGPSTAEVMGVVSKLYEKLPQEFKGGKAMTGNIEEDRYGFQGELVDQKRYSPKLTRGQPPISSSHCRLSRWSWRVPKKPMFPNAA